MNTNAAAEIGSRVFRAEIRQDSTDRIIEAMRGETDRRIADTDRHIAEMREDMREMREENRAFREELRADAERRKEETDRSIADLRADAERRTAETDRRMADFHETVQEIRADIREIRADGRSLRLWLLGTTIATILGVAAVVAAIGQMQVSWVQRELDAQKERIVAVEDGLKQQKRDFDDFRRETAERFDRLENLILGLHGKIAPRAEADAPRPRR